MHNTFLLEWQKGKKNFVSAPRRMGSAYVGAYFVKVGKFTQFSIPMYRAETSFRRFMIRRFMIQCCKAANEANRKLGMIKRGFKNRTRAVMLPLYKAMVRPHLNYCIQAWRPHLKKDIDRLERVQRRATRMIEGLEGLSYLDRLGVLGLTSDHIGNEVS